MKVSHWLLLGSLYVSQFLPVAFLFMGLPVILRAEGMALEQIGALYGLGMVWVLKLFWAPLVDRIGAGRRNHYRGWLVLMQLAMVGMLLIISTIAPVGQFTLLVLLGLGLTVFAATQDVATDALACKMLPQHLRGLGNGVQIAGGLIGMILGGGAMLHVYQAFGWQSSVFGLAAIVGLVLVQILLFDESAIADTPAPHGGTDRVRPGVSRLWRLWMQPGMGKWALVLLSLPAGISIVFTILPPMLVDLGWDVAQTGTLLNVIGPIAGILAAFATGGLIRSYDARSVLPFAPALQIIAMSALLPLAMGIDTTLAIYLGVILVFVAHNIAATIAVTMIMARVNKGCEGSDFTSQHSVYLLMGFFTGGLALQLAPSLGYVTVIYLAAVVAFGTITMTLQMRRKTV